jgi:hypothetical protein
MLISDLTYLEAVTEETSIVGGITNQTANQKLTFTENVNINKNVKAQVAVKGNLVFIENDGQALGKNSLVQVLNNFKAEKGKSSVSSTVVAAAGS